MDLVCKQGWLEKSGSQGSFLEEGGRGRTAWQADREEHSQVALGAGTGPGCPGRGTVLY